MGLNERYDQPSNTWFMNLQGEIDIYNASELKDNIIRLLEQNQGNINFDCQDLKYIDSTGLGVLINVLNHVKEYDGIIKIVNLRPYIYKIFMITGLNKIFDIEVTEE